MKHIFLTLTLSFSVLFCFSQIQNEKKTTFLKDLKVYRQIIETSHSGMYLYTSKSEFDVIFEEAFQSIEANEIVSDRDFFLLVSAIHTKINCGHSSTFPTAEIFSTIADNQKTFFPLKVKFIGDTLVIASDYNDFKKGTQLLRINNKSIQEIKKDAFKIISSDGFNTTFKYRQLEEEFSKYYFLLYGSQEKFDLEIITYLSNTISKVTLESITINQFKEFKPSERTQKATDLSFLNKETALLTVNTFSTETKKNQKKFFKFLEKTFKEIQEKGIENLILDIRENTGGDDGNDMELASYLINKPFKENKYRKLNTIDLPVYPQHLHPQWKQMMGIPKKKTPEEIKASFKNEFGDEFFQGEDGAYYLKEKNVIKRNPSKYLFVGRTYILISGKVFSGGALFSALVRDKSNATFVGEETGGGYYRHTGSIPLIYKLPNSGIVFSIFIVINEQDVEQQLFPDGRGIVPHVEIYPTIKDFVEDKDAVLDYVKSKLRNK